MKAFRWGQLRAAARCACILCCVSAVLNTPLFTTARAAEYRLQPGDAVEFAAAGAPELKYRATISLDGSLTLPLIGVVKAADLFLAELRAKVQEQITSKVYRRRSDDGREYPVIISPDDVTLAIIEYRPVYLNGDVSKPGEQAYRPGLTVRQAVALAGGYDLVRFRMNNPFMEIPDLRGEYKALWNQFAKEKTVVQRLQAELDNKSTLEGGGLDRLPIAPEIRSRIEALEAKQLGLRNAIHARTKAFLETSIKKEESRISLVAEQRGKEKEAAQIDTAELSRVQSLVQKGNIPVPRLVEARRTILAGSQRFLETVVRQAQLERERDDLAERLGKLDDQRRVDLLRELQETNLKVTMTGSRLEAVGEKLVYAGMVRSQLVQGENLKPELVIFRKNGQTREQMDAQEDTELLPGDVVEVALRRELLLGRSSPANSGSAN
jgi:polysaccharide biosynthesis/export protein